MRILAAAAVLGAMAMASPVLAQTYGDSGAHAYRHHRQAQDYDGSWRSQRAYEQQAPAPGWGGYEGHTRGEGGAAWDPGSANGS